MKIFEITQPRKSPLLEAVGRDLQHVEDLVFINGAEGALHAIQRLRGVGVDSKQLLVKWDGSPACKFGRDDQGQFHFGDKHSKELVTSADALAQQVMNRKYAGKGDAAVDAARQQFAQSQSNLWQLYEAATPKDFRGFVSGDLMWQAPPKVVNGEYIVAPNTVQYMISTESEIGQQMRSSQTGIALHFYSPAFDGQDTPITANIISQLGNDKVTILGPKTTASVQQANVNTAELDKLEQIINTNASDIEEYLAPVQGLSNIPAVIYKYVNSHQSSATLEHFLQWCQETLSAGQYAKIAAKPVTGLQTIFTVMHNLVKIKVDVIDQLESQALSSSGIRAILHKTNATGGEGLVLPAGTDTPPLKFVNRNTFSAANRIR